MIIIIAAVSQNGVIGRNGSIPWRLKSDMLAFKRITSGGTIIMGRKTWNSLPTQPLPNRHNIVVSKQDDFKLSDATVSHSLEGAIEAAKNHRFFAGNGNIFIIGGASLYEEGFKIADGMMITRVLGHIEGDVRFPAFGTHEWRRVERVPRERDSQDEFRSVLEVYSRKPQA